MDHFAEFARLLGASLDDQDRELLSSTAAEIRETVTPLHDVLSTGPKLWGSARAAAWLAMKAIAMLEERLKGPVVDWDYGGADVIITVSGIELLVAQWSQVLGS